MRRTFAAAVLATAVAAAVVPAGTSTAATGDGGPGSFAAFATSASDELLPVDQDAVQALERAQAVLGGTTGAAPGERVEGTLAMRNLFAALPDLSEDEHVQARSVLARPTDGNQDPYGDGYRTTAKRTCEGHFCIHWVPTTSDAPPSRAWVNTTLDTMQQVWRKEVGGLGYRRPVKDGRHGGNDLFDVYLKDVGANGLYGYCAPEYLKPGRKREASGYCVLDNDFAKSQYGAEPINSLRVTAAHEFFHAIQFAYDYKEDGWLMEATATWMEERYADAINDNRQYLPYGQVARPGAPLDVYNQNGFNQYGNWPFFEYLSSRYGNAVVRRTWEAAGEYPGGGHLYSAQAVVDALRDHGGFRGVYTRFAAGNLTPATTYAEGDDWSAETTGAALARNWSLTSSSPQESASLKINHLAAQDLAVKPASSLGAGWRGRVTVDAPATGSPRAYVIIRRTNGDVVPRVMKLGADGNGTTTFAFDHDSVAKVTVTLANASTRFDCHQQTSYSCHGASKDDHAPFTVTATAFQG